MLSSPLAKGIDALCSLNPLVFRLSPFVILFALSFVTVDCTHYPESRFIAYYYNVLVLCCCFRLVASWSFVSYASLILVASFAESITLLWLFHCISVWWIANCQLPNRTAPPRVLRSSDPLSTKQYAYAPAPEVEDMTRHETTRSHRSSACVR